MNSRSSLLAAVFALLLAACVTPPSPTATPAPSDAPPRVLLLGDSISIGYTPFVQEALAGRAEVQRPLKIDSEGSSSGRPENCQGTTHGLTRLEDWLAQDGGGWDVIHVNFGLHDLKRVKPETGGNSNDPTHPHQASPSAYRRQLRIILERLLETDARIVFATTTPVPDGELRPHREPADSVIYNRVALDVVRLLRRDHGARLAVNDLFAFVEATDPTIKRLGDVHFSKDGSRMLGEEVARVVAEVAERP